MYLYAWKQGLKTTYYLRSRPATRIAKAASSTHAPRRRPAAPTPDPRRRQVACSLENPEILRGLPVSTQSNRRAHAARPGICLTLRPMRYPSFYEMYRAAIKNTWTVEEVDFSTDVGDLAQAHDRRPSAT